MDGKRNEKYLKSVVRFAGDDLENYRAGDWLNAREDLLALLGWTPDMEPIDRGPALCLTKELDQILNVSEDDLRVLHGDIYSILDSFVGPLPLNSTRFVRLGSGVDVKVRYSPDKKRSGANLTIMGDFRDLVLHQFVSHLIADGGARVIRCLGCDKIFYKHGKQEYCSRTCTNRVMVRRKRKKDEEKLRATDKDYRKKKAAEERKKLREVKAKLAPFGIRLEEEKKKQRRKRTK